MSATFATLTARMRLNPFAHSHQPEPEAQSPEQPGTATTAAPTGRSFPADEIVWGIVIRNGFDELDDPWYHRGTTQHAYLEGNDNVAICGFRPPQSGPRTRRRSRLGLPTAGEHPMCGSCARMVVAPRPRVPVPVQSSRPPVAVPVTRAVAQPVAVPQPAHAAAVAPTAPTPAAPVAQPTQQVVSPWVQRRTQGPQAPAEAPLDIGHNHDGGLLRRGVHTQTTEEE